MSAINHVQTVVLFKKLILIKVRRCSGVPRPSRVGRPRKLDGYETTYIVERIVAEELGLNTTVSPISKAYVAVVIYDFIEPDVDHLVNLVAEVQEPEINCHFDVIRYGRIAL